MSQMCPVCGPDKPYPDEEPFCPLHLGVLEPYRAAPEPDNAPPEPAPAGPSKCWNCGTEPFPSNTSCHNPECGRSLTPPALVIRFPDGQVELERGNRVQLGRHGEHGRIFRSHRNVSRLHAVVGMESDGQAWIEPNPTPNGTFVDGKEIPDSRQYHLQSNQIVRFARDATGRITIYPSRRTAP